MDKVDFSKVYSILVMIRDINYDEPSERLDKVMDEFYFHFEKEIEHMEDYYKGVAKDIEVHNKIFRLEAKRDSGLFNEDINQIQSEIDKLKGRLDD